MIFTYGLICLTRGPDPCLYPILSFVTRTANKPFEHYAALELHLGPGLCVYSCNSTNWPWQWTQPTLNHCKQHLQHYTNRKRVCRYWDDKLKRCQSNRKDWLTLLVSRYYYSPIKYNIWLCLLLIQDPQSRRSPLLYKILLSRMPQAFMVDRCLTPN